MSIIDWNDPEQVREYRRKWRAEHKDAISEKNKKYRIAHHDEIIEKQRIYREAHREHINRLRREKRKKNIPAGDGIITVDLWRHDEWKQKSYSNVNFLYQEDMGIEYDEMEKYRRIKEYE